MLHRNDFKIIIIITMVITQLSRMREFKSDIFNNCVWWYVKFIKIITSCDSYMWILFILFLCLYNVSQLSVWCFHPTQRCLPGTNVSTKWCLPGTNLSSKMRLPGTKSDLGIMIIRPLLYTGLWKYHIHFYIHLRKLIL